MSFNESEPSIYSDEEWWMGILDENSGWEFFVGMVDENGRH